MLVGPCLWMISTSALRGAVLTDVSEAYEVNAFQFVWSDLRSSKWPFDVLILCAVARCCDVQLH